MSARADAITILNNVIFQGHSLTPELKKFSDHPKAALIKQYCFGTLRWYFQLQEYLDQLVKKPLKDPQLSCLILLAMYELDHMKTAEHAVVNESVKLTKKYNKDWARGLVNGVLRNFIRKKTSLNSNNFAHPKWLLKELKQAWPSRWQEIVTENNTHAPMIIRVNQSKMSLDLYLDKFPIEAHKIEGYPEALRLETPVSVNKLPGFDEGIASVQDCSAQLAPHLLDLKSDQRVLDACAAPGGKSCHILELEPKIAELVAIDIDADRTQLIRENLERLHLNATVLTADATNPDSWWDGKTFDRILIDAPCSATGIIRRHPDIKIHRTQQDIINLCEQQSKILNALWPLLAPDGLLVYATCSVLPQENNAIIQAFLTKNSDATLAEPEKQLFPENNGGDGFYYAVLKKSH